MFAIERLADVPQMLSLVYHQRIQADKLPPGDHTLRGPVGLFLVREDGAGGSKLAEEIVRSFGYWDVRSRHFFDGVFLGWGFDQVPVFVDRAFAHCVEDLESCLSWKYRGGAHLLLADFVYDPRVYQGSMDFSVAIPLDISELLEERKLAQLSPLIEELIAPVRTDRAREAEVSVWEISDYIGVLRARRFFWQTLVSKMGALLGLVDAVAPYAVRDLRKRTN